MYEEACRKGWEGVIAKRADSPYATTRSKDWLKFKCEMGQEMVIGGYTAPKGSRTDLGALLRGLTTTAMSSTTPARSAPASTARRSRTWPSG